MADILRSRQRNDAPVPAPVPRPAPTAHPAVFSYPGEEYLLGAERGQAPPALPQPQAPAPTPTLSTSDVWRGYVEAADTALAQRQAAQEQVAEGQRRVAESWEAQRAALAPQRAELARLLREDLPEPPEPFAPTPPPDRSIRPFLEGPGDESPWATLQRVVFGLGVVAQMASAAHAGYAQGALASLTEAVTGWAQGQKEAGDRAFETWREHMDQLYRAKAEERQRYRAALERHGARVDQLTKALLLDAAEFGEQRAALEALVAGDLTFLEWKDKEYQIVKNLYEKALELGVRYDLARIKEGTQHTALTRQALEWKFGRADITDPKIVSETVQEYRDYLERTQRERQALMLQAGSGLAILRGVERDLAKSEGDFNTIRSWLNQMKRLSARINRFGSVGRFAGYPLRWLAEQAQTEGIGTDIVQLRTLSARLGVLARTIGRETGVLTQQDIDRMRALEVSPHDTAQAAHAKIAEAERLVEDAFTRFQQTRDAHLNRTRDMLERLGVPMILPGLNAPAFMGPGPSAGAAPGYRMIQEDDDEE